MGWEKDVPPGEEIVACLRPFLEHLVTCANLSPTNIQKHVDKSLGVGRRDQIRPSVSQPDAPCLLIQLPIFNRNQGNIAAAKAHRFSNSSLF
jgi:hypothetical protein